MERGRIGLSDAEGAGAPFGDDMKHRLVEEFVVGYYNGSVKPNLAEKNPMNGRDAEYLMDGFQFERIRKSDVWSCSDAVGTGYRYRVTYKDRRFSDLDPLLDVYSGRTSPEDTNRSAVEQRLYDLIMLLVKEGRLPKSFKIRPAKDQQAENLTAELARLNRTLGELEERIRKLEEALAARKDPEVPSSPPTVG